MSFKYMIVNRASDFERGMLVNLKVENETLVMNEQGGLSKSSYYMASFDSGEREFFWNRAVVEIGDFEGFVVISAYASDIDYMPNTKQTVDEYLKDVNISQAEKKIRLDKLYTKVFTNAQDVILDIKGQYLYLKIDIVLTNGTGPILSAVKVCVQSDHMFEYLPAVYQKKDDGFLFRFLSIFDSITSDLEQDINTISDAFDFERQNGNLLKFLASWVSVDSLNVNDEELRQVIADAVKDYELMSTPNGIKKLIKRWTGEEPIIIEHFQLASMQKSGLNSELYSKLFSTNKNTFCIVLSQKTFESEKKAQLFLERLKEYIPANVKPELILLKDSVHLDSHTFLGMNSAVVGYKDVAINHSVAIENDTVIGGNSIEK